MSGGTVAWPMTEAAEIEVRRVLVPVSYAFMAAMLREGAEIHRTIVSDGLPEDARIVGVVDEPLRAVFSVVVEHESFWPVSPGQRLPEVIPSHTSYTACCEGAT